MLTEHFPFNYQLRLLINTHYLNILVYEIVEFQNLINIISKAVREMVRSVSFLHARGQSTLFFFLSIFTYWLTCHHSGIDNRESYLITEKLAYPVLDRFRLIYLAKKWPVNLISSKERINDIEGRNINGHIFGNI